MEFRARALRLLAVVVKAAAVSAASLAMVRSVAPLWSSSAVNCRRASDMNAPGGTWTLKRRPTVCSPAPPAVSSVNSRSVLVSVTLPSPASSASLALDVVLAVIVTGTAAFGFSTWMESSAICTPLAASVTRTMNLPAPASAAPGVPVSAPFAATRSHAGPSSFSKVSAPVPPVTSPASVALYG